MKTIEKLKSVESKIISDVSDEFFATEHDMLLLCTDILKLSKKKIRYKPVPVLTIEK
jgi:hypothetical protein